MLDVYLQCPTIKSANHTLRLAKVEDAPGLLKVYSDERNLPYFNSDNCHGDNFHYTTLEKMRQVIQWWNEVYDQQGFVRWTILNEADEPVGTVELFHRDAADAYTDCGLLRLDLCRECEKLAVISDILTALVPQTFSMFDCSIIATKIPPYAEERAAAFREHGFRPSDAPLVNPEGTEYWHYWIKSKEERA